MKLAAMICKSEYLEGCEEPAETKRLFRTLQQEGEREFSLQPAAGPAPWSQWLLRRGYPNDWRERRADNTRRLIDCVSGHTAATPLFCEWPEDHCPLTAVLVFPSEELRDRVRRRLIASDIYATVLWPMDTDAGADARTLSSRLLCIPTDQRYDREDMERTADTLREIERRS
jgi:hypothetical protein